MFSSSVLIMSEKLPRSSPAMNAKVSLEEKQLSKTPRLPLMKLSAYLFALRPWSFSASLMPVILGYALALKSGYDTSLLSLVVAALTALSVHGAGNIVNTYYDYVKGVDKKGSDDRTLVDHLLSKDETTMLGIILYTFGCLGFIVLALISKAHLDQLAIVYFGGLSSSFLYTGAGLKYIAMGDLLVLTIFGPITVLFSYIIQTGVPNWGMIVYAIPLALGSEAILHANNTRDLKSDQQAGIVTLSILIGQTASEVLFAVFLLSPYSIFIIWGINYSPWLLLPLITIPEAFKHEKEFRTISKQNIPKRTAQLYLYIGLLYIFGLFLSDGPQLPFLRSYVK